MFYTLYFKNNNEFFKYDVGKYYLIKNEQENPNHYFEGICLDPWCGLYGIRDIIYKQLTIDEFNDIIKRYNLKNFFQPGDYANFEAEDNLLQIKAQSY